MVQKVKLFFMMKKNHYLVRRLSSLKNSSENFIYTKNFSCSIAAYSSLLSPLGCFIAGIVMDLIGRKHTMQLLYLPFILSWGLIACAKNVDTLYIAFLGLSIGVGKNTKPYTYLSEKYWKFKKNSVIFQEWLQCLRWHMHLKYVPPNTEDHC